MPRKMCFQRAGGSWVSETPQVQAGKPDGFLTEPSLAACTIPQLALGAEARKQLLTSRRGGAQPSSTARLDS